jgi:hypothetical protein
MDARQSATLALFDHTNHNFVTTKKWNRPRRAILQTALSRVIRANFAASCHGSMSNRASAERTLSIGPSLRSSTEA